MIKKIRIFAVVMAIALVFTACSQTQSEGETDTPAAQVAPPDLATLADNMHAAGTWGDELMLLDPAVIPNLYEVGEGNVAEIFVYSSSTMSTAEEVAIFMAEDEESVAYIEEMIDLRLQSLQFAFEDYIPEEMPKIENAKVITNGLYVALIVADDTSAVEDVFNAAFGG